MIKHHLEEMREGIIKKLNKIIIGKTPVERNAIYYFNQNLFLLVVLTCWKRTTFQISMKFHFKKRGKINFDTLFPPSFDVLHSWPMVYMNHTELIFQDLLIYCTRRSNTGVKHTSCCMLRPWYRIFLTGRPFGRGGAVKL